MMVHEREQAHEYSSIDSTPKGVNCPAKQCEGSGATIDGRKLV